MQWRQPIISPQDIVILLKIIAYGDEVWIQTRLAESLYLSQSEISKSLLRSKFSGLIDPSGKKVRRLALMEFLQYGIAYAFPQRPGPIVRGVPTAHSAPPLNHYIKSEEAYVWPSIKGKVKGQGIGPLYPSAVEAALEDPRMHEFLALIDALRVGRAREKEIALAELKKRILDDA